MASRKVLAVPKIQQQTPTFAWKVGYLWHDYVNSFTSQPFDSFDWLFGKRYKRGKIIKQKFGFGSH